MGKGSAESGYGLVASGRLETISFLISVGCRQSHAVIARVHDFFIRERANRGAKLLAVLGFGGANKKSHCYREAPTKGPHTRKTMQISEAWSHNSSC
jgi:hypothetical protein